MAGDIKKDLRTEARSFSDSLSNVFLMKKRDPQTKHLLEKAQQVINGLLSETPPRQGPAPPAPRTTRPATGMGQLWVKLDELKRENDDLKRHRARAGEDRAGSPKSPKSPKPQIGHTDTLGSDLQKIKNENEALKVQVEKLQKTIKEHEKINSHMQDECKRSKAALEAAQKLTKKARDDMKKMEASVAVKKTEKEKEMKKQKSSQQASPPPPAKPPVNSPKPKVRTDNRHTENINERCRPSNIALAYTTLESQQWMDAKEALEDLSDNEEEEITKFLCDIMMTSYRASHDVLRCVESVVGEILENPTMAVQLMEQSQHARPVKLPDEMSDAIAQRLRASYDKIDLQQLADIIRKNFSATASSLQPQLTGSHVEKYIKECGAVSWQMAIQKPPMALSANHTKFDDVKHKLWWSCNQSKAKRINYFIWPVLFDYEGGNLMVKGCVHAS